MYAPVTRTDIAEIYDAIGRTEQAALMRSLAEDDRRDEEAMAAGLFEAVEAIERLLARTEEQDRAKHDENCWRKHAACLADQIRELLP